VAESRFEGWTAPVFRGLSEPFLVGKVSPLLLVPLFVTTLLLALLVSMRIIPYGVALWGGGAALTAWEPQFWGLWRRYRQYDTYYEA
jgi:type IV secretory pathway TrbD component